MTGQWKAVTDSGQEMVLTYQWAVKGHAIVSTFKMTDQYGQATDVGIAFSKIDATTMKVGVYGLENGELSYNAWFEINYKRQKK